MSAATNHRINLEQTRAHWKFADAENFDRMEFVKKSSANRKPGGESVKKENGGLRKTSGNKFELFRRAARNVSWPSR